MEIKTVYEDDDFIIKKQLKTLLLYSKHHPNVSIKIDGIMVSTPTGKLLPCTYNGESAFLLSPTPNNDNGVNPKDKHID